MRIASVAAAVSAACVLLASGSIAHAAAPSTTSPRPVTIVDAPARGSSVTVKSPVVITATLQSGARMTIMWGDKTRSVSPTCAKEKNGRTLTTRTCTWSATHSYSAPGSAVVRITGTGLKARKIPLTIVAGSSSESDAIIHQQGAKAVNDVRSEAGAPAVVLCEPLNRAAEEYAQVLADTGRVQHVGPDGGNAGTRAQQAGYEWTVIGENLGTAGSTADSMVAKWAADPGRYRNLVGAEFTHVGIGQAVNDAGVYYWVQMMGAGGSCG